MFRWTFPAATPGMMSQASCRLQSALEYWIKVRKSAPVGKEWNNSGIVWRQITTNDTQNICKDFQVEEWCGVSPGATNWWAYVCTLLKKWQMPEEWSRQSRCSQYWAQAKTNTGRSGHISLMWDDKRVAVKHQCASQHNSFSLKGFFPCVNSSSLYELNNNNNN